MNFTLIRNILVFGIIAAKCKAFNSACYVSAKAKVQCTGENKTQCLARGCCWDQFASNFQCYAKKLVKVGGEPGFSGSSILKRCSLSRGTKTCGGKTTNRNTCARFGCCWIKGECKQAIYNVLKLRDRCPPGFANPPKCEEIDPCQTNPCQMGGTCINLEEGFKCNCPGDTISGPLCNDGCLPPSSIHNGFFTNTSNFYDTDSTVTYECNPGYVLHGFPLNFCLGRGDWALQGSNLPVCLPGGDKDLDVLIILDSSDSLDNCLTRFPNAANRLPLFPGDILTPENFPNFFQQQKFVTGFESSWKSVSRSTTRVALHLHAGQCGEHSFPLRRLSDTELVNTNILLPMLMNFCSKPNFSEILKCSSRFHFTPVNGDRPDAENVIVLVVPDISKDASKASEIIQQVVQIRKHLDAKLFALTSVNPFEVTLDVFLQNISFITNLACEEFAFDCNRVLGTIYDPPDLIASVIRAELEDSLTTF